MVQNESSKPSLEVVPELTEEKDLVLLGEIHFEELNCNEEICKTVSLDLAEGEITFAVHHKESAQEITLSLEEMHKVTDFIVRILKPNPALPTVS